jgi:peptide-methionine (S)-S-oxide reductase
MRNSILLALVFATLTVCGQKKVNTKYDMEVTENMELATLGAGCFWCVEAVFQDLIGVASVQSGYTGGQKPNPTYKEVCTGTTGHVEVCQIAFDPRVITYEEILEAFWASHDPTTLNRQGNDVGTQYRSVIFYHSEKQKFAALKSLETANRELWGGKIVTTIEPLKQYYPAEDYHQNYFKLNPYQSYCSLVIAPKVKKFREKFAHKLKK